MKKIPPKIETIALAREALEDLKGVDLRMLDVRGLTQITDWMLVCTGTSNRHVKALAESVIEKSKAAGLRPNGVEGLEVGEWVLVDLGDVLVHVMQAQTRAFYQLEKLWDLDNAHAHAG
jgi:iojap-related protein